MINGVGTAIITPFNDDMSIDYNRFEKLINYQINNGVDALVILGTTGEAPVIDDTEREDIIKFVSTHVNGRVKVIVGTGTNDTKHLLAHNRLAEKYNVDGLLVVNPYYNKGTQKSLVAHYKYISENTSLPIALYNVPSRTGMNVLPETAVEIFEKCDNVVAIKEASGDISQIAKLIAMKPKEFMVLSGNDDQTLPIIALGGGGVISSGSNALPKEMVLIASAALSNKFNEAKSHHNNYVKLLQLLFNETNPIPIKYLVSKLGLCLNTFRLPLIPASKRTEDILSTEFNYLFDKNLIFSKQ